MNLAQLNEFITQFNSVFSNSTDENRKKAFDNITKRLIKQKKVLKNQAESNNQLIIAIVGQMNVGKSSLLNSLLFEGDKVLPVSSAPMTACLTVIQYEKEPEKQRFEVEYYTKEDWGKIKSCHEYVSNELNDIKKDRISKGLDSGDGVCKQKFKEDHEAKGDYALLMAYYELYEKMKQNPDSGMKIGQPNDSVYISKLTEFARELDEYVGANGKYSSVVKSVSLFINSDLLTYTNESTGLTESYKIVDTPGVNDPIESRDRVAKEFLLKAHAAIMLVDAHRYQAQSNITFINNHIIEGGMSKVLFTLNKLDVLFNSASEKLPDKLLDAMEDYVGYVDGEYQESGELYDGFENRVKTQLKNPDAIMLTVVCSLAEQTRLKLEKAGNIGEARLLEEEEKLIDNLAKYFPEDFCKNNPELANNLKLLGGFERLKKVFLQNEFLANKDSIISQRYAEQNHLDRESILEQFKHEVEEVNGNHTLLGSVDLQDLRNQVQSLGKLKDGGLKQLQECVDVVVRRLKAFIEKTLFAEELVPYKPTLKGDATGYENVSYTRKGTNTIVFGGNVKYEDVMVNRVQPESVVSSHGSEIDELHKQLKKRWKDNFLKERDALVQSLVNSIQEIANKDTSLGIDAAVYTKALENVVDHVLIGREILDVGSWIDAQKIDLDKFARNTMHTTLDTSYSQIRMTTKQAQSAVRSQAMDKVNNFKTGMSTRYVDFYDGLKFEVLKEIADINDKLTSFVNDVSGQLAQVFMGFIQQKNQMIENRQNAEIEKEKLIADLNEFKDKFERL